MTAYRVTGQYVTCRSESTATAVPAGYLNAAVVGLHKGVLLPPDAHPDHVAHLLRRGLIEAVPVET